MTRISKMIDHTLLKPYASPGDIKRLCMEAIKYDFASVCINPCWVELAGEELKGADVNVCTVIGFPLGSNLTQVKVLESKLAVKQGAKEIDVVINIGKLKSKDYAYVENEISQIVNEVKGRALVKVIIETCLLTHDEKIKACELAVEAGADFVKTSTGYSTGGATVEDVKLMKQTVGDKAKVKASTGIKTIDDVEKLIKAGAVRFGTSSGIAIVKGSKEKI
ncbi:MAG TPA: deoxyribose-phosphate aldolase [Clostridiaceae bacterium]|nr:deoxyribose-phosphate aldolase [Clostridiaceae bacterium]